MIFQHRFSTKQSTAIFYFIFGLILVYISLDVKVGIEKVVLVLGVLFIFHAAQEFAFDIKRKKVIKNPYKTNRYESNGESQLADYFKKRNIIFYHHPQLKFNRQYGPLTIPFVNKKFEPDFYLPEFHIYIEYNGMMDKPEYKTRVEEKRKYYKMNDIEYIEILPEQLNNLDWVFMQKLLERFKVREGLERKWR